MSGISEALSAQQLITLANQTLPRYPDFFSALEITGVRQQGELLIFSGPWFADAEGLPTHQSTIAFNAFKFLTVELSPLYCLKE